MNWLLQARNCFMSRFGNQKQSLLYKQPIRKLKRNEILSILQVDQAACKVIQVLK